jgi:hypothetical protein
MLLLKRGESFLQLRRNLGILIQDVFTADSAVAHERRNNINACVSVTIRLAVSRLAGRRMDAQSLSCYSLFSGASWYMENRAMSHVFKEDVPGNTLSTAACPGDQRVLLSG